MSDIKKVCIVVNGKPRSGKDTVVKFMSSTFQYKRWSTWAYSSITPVKSLIAHTGIDISKKTDEDRALMSEIGMALEKHSEWRTNCCADAVAERLLHSDDKSTVVFVHMREPKLIIKFKNAIERKVSDVIFKTLFVERKKVQLVTSNESDAGVYDMVYDYTMFNDDSLQALEFACDVKVDTIIEEFEDDNDISESDSEITQHGGTE